MAKVHHLHDLVKATVIKRPSKTCKSPYVADVIINGSDDTIMAHAPALGCDGLCDSGAIVFLSLLPSKKGAVCTHRIELAETEAGVIVGINPKLAEEIVENAIMKTESTKEYKREKTILNSRFDFVGLNSENKYFVLEVKTVPLCVEPGVAFFPHGYRKKKGDPVSPRALKHLNDLIEIAQKSESDAIMCYVIQRGDAHTFIPSDSDPIYKDKFYAAKAAGVKMMNLFVEWKNTGECFSQKSTYF